MKDDQIRNEIYTLEDMKKKLVADARGVLDYQTLAEVIQIWIDYKKYDYAIHELRKVL
jgi:hypothetical protein